MPFATGQRTKQETKSENLCNSSVVAFAQF